MVLQTTTHDYTVEEFDEFVMLPENADKTFEYIGGEIIEMVSNRYSSYIAAKILGEIYIYLKTHDIGHITGADGGYMIGNERYIPDVAFTTYTKQKTPSHEVYDPIPPDLVVEVLSPSNTSYEMRVKVANYLHAGIVVWVVDPDKKRVEIFDPKKEVEIIPFDGIIHGGDVLQGFQLPVKDIFPE